MSQPSPPNPAPEPKSKPKVDYSEQLFTPYGTKKDNEKIMQGFLDELHTTNQKYKEKSMQILIDREMKNRKASTSYQKSAIDSKKEIPIDGDITSGSRLFVVNCISCHSLEINNKGLKASGPALGLIYGRTAGSDQNFEYSRGLTAANFSWNEKRLFDFLKGPKEMIPDVRCEIPGGGIEGKGPRADLVKFLKKFTKELHKNVRVKANQIYGREYVDYQISTRKGLQKIEMERLKEKVEKEKGNPPGNN